MLDFFQPPCFMILMKLRVYPSGGGDFRCSSNPLSSCFVWPFQTIQPEECVRPVCDGRGSHPGVDGTPPLAGERRILASGNDWHLNGGICECQGQIHWKWFPSGGQSDLWSDLQTHPHWVGLVLTQYSQLKVTHQHPVDLHKNISEVIRVVQYIKWMEFLSF